MTIVNAVVSWPPPCVAVEKKQPAGLPTRAPDCQRDPVESKTAFICAHAIPKRVGVPEHEEGKWGEWGGGDHIFCR